MIDYGNGDDDDIGDNRDDIGDDVLTIIVMTMLLVMI